MSKENYSELANTKIKRDKIIEDEEDEELVKHQFFKKHRFRPIFDIVLSYLYIFEKVNIAKCNKNCYSIFKNTILKYTKIIVNQAINFFINSRNEYTASSRFQIDFKNENCDIINDENFKSIREFILPKYLFKRIKLKRPFKFLGTKASRTMSQLGCFLIAYNINNKEYVQSNFYVSYKNLLNLFSCYYFKLNHLVSIELNNCTFTLDLNSSFGTTVEKIFIRKSHITGNNLLFTVLNKSKKNLKCLILEDNNLTGDNISLFLEDNNCLKELNFSNNLLTKENAVAMVETLSLWENNLEILNIKNNRLHSETTEKIFDVLAESSKLKGLKKLNLSGNAYNANLLLTLTNYLTSQNCGLEYFIYLNMSVNYDLIADIFNLYGKDFNVKYICIDYNYKINRVINIINTNFNKNIILTKYE